MPSFLHQPAARNHDVAHFVASSAEYESVDQRVLVAAREEGRVSVQHDDVGATTGFDSANVARSRTRACGACMSPQHRTRRRVVPRRKHIAMLGGQTRLV